MVDEAQIMLEEAGFCDQGWEVQDEVTLISPNGWPIEWDGTSPDGEESPLRVMGLI